MFRLYFKFLINFPEILFSGQIIRDIESLLEQHLEIKNLDFNIELQKLDSNFQNNKIEINI